MTGNPYNTQAWKRLRQKILLRDGFLCQVRGPRCLGTATEADHIMPTSLGGPMYDESNLRAACSRCNKGRAQAPEVYAEAASRRPSREW